MIMLKKSESGPYPNHLKRFPLFNRYLQRVNSMWFVPESNIRDTRIMEMTANLRYTWSTNSSSQYYRKYIKNGLEKIHTNERV